MIAIVLSNYVKKTRLRKIINLLSKQVWNAFRELSDAG